MKTSNIDKLCWIAFLILTILLFTSCKTTKRAKPCKECPQFTTMKIPYHDTIYFERIHDHIELNCKNYCIYIEESSFPYTDTIYLDVLEGN